MDCSCLPPFLGEIFELKAELNSDKKEKKKEAVKKVIASMTVGKDVRCAGVGWVAAGGFIAWVQFTSLRVSPAIRFFPHTAPFMNPLSKQKVLSRGGHLLKCC